MFTDEARERKGYNLSMVELKQGHPLASQVDIPRYNLSMVELKLENLWILTLGFRRYNLSMVELKLISLRNLGGVSVIT